MMTATRRGVRGLGWRSARTVATLVITGLLVPSAWALKIDDRGEMRLGLRAYTSVRLGTEHMGGSDNPLTFPDSGVAHVRQNRYFLEIKFDHDITRIGTTGTGFAWLFGWMNPSLLKYSLQYRGEGESIYDHGPAEFSDGFATGKRVHLDVPDLPPVFDPSPPNALIHQRVSHLRRVARVRNRFFTGYLDFEKGPVFVRVGRQILAWGETDIFRLLDNINPLDQGFGGFLIALDERRVPLDMARGSYHFGSIGPLADAQLEGFAAFGNRVSTQPGIPPGSPWIPGGRGRPNPAVRTEIEVPDRTEIRGGGMFKFNYRDATVTLAHYYTYLDTPGVVFHVPGARPNGGLAAPGFGHEIIATQRMPRTPITGASITFPLPSWYTIVRSEAAYFRDEPVNRQGRGFSGDSTCPNPKNGTGTGLGCPQAGGYGRLKAQNNPNGGLDPFVFPGFADITRQGAIEGSLLQRDSFSYALGFDINRFVHWINPTQTLFISTQVFYKHYFNSPGDLILPVPVYNRAVAKNIPAVGSLCGPANDRRPCELQPRFIHNQDNQVLHTLLITTAYAGGRIVPSYGMFYDWSGAFVFQPGVQLVRDPFRFVFDYTRLNAGIGSGQLSALRDRDNVRFQVEYVF